MAKKEIKESKKDQKMADDSSIAETQEIINEENNTLDNDGRVGTMLKDTRIKKGEELEKIAKVLRIRKNFLEAIENSNYDELPPAPYGQGFVRAYAEYLGLNSVRIAQLYREETEANLHKKDMYVLEPQSEATIPNRKYIILSLIAIILIYLGWMYYSRPATDLSVATAPVVDSTTPAGNFPLQIEEFEVAEPAVATKTSEQEAEEIKQEQQAEKNEVIVPDSQSPVAEKKEVPEVIVEPKENNKVEQIKIEEGNFTEEVSEEQSNENTEEEKNVQDNKVIPTDSKVVVKVKKETWFEAKDKDTLYISKVVQDGFTYNVPNKEGMIISVGRVDAADVYVNGKLTTVFTANKKTGISVDDLLKSANH